MVVSPSDFIHLQQDDCVDYLDFQNKNLENMRNCQDHSRGVLLFRNSSFNSERPKASTFGLAPWWPN